MKLAFILFFWTFATFAEQAYIRGHAEATIRNNLPAQRNPYRTPHTMLLPGVFALRAESWCGSGDFVKFVKDYPGFDVFEDSMSADPVLPAVLGLWFQPRLDPTGEANPYPLPTSSNWYPLAIGSIPIDGAAITTLTDIHKARTDVPIGQMIRETLTTLRTLVGYRMPGQPRSYVSDAVDVYLTIQTCQPYIDQNTPADDTPSALEVAQSFNVAVAPDSFLADAVVSQIDTAIENEVFASLQTRLGLEANLNRYNLSIATSNRVQFALDPSSGAHTVADATNTDLWDLAFEVFDLATPAYPMTDCNDYASKVQTIANQAKLLAARTGLRSGSNCNSTQVPGIRSTNTPYWWEFYSQNGACAFLQGQEKSEPNREQFTMLPTGSRHQLYELLFKTAAECSEDSYYPPTPADFVQAKLDMTQLLLRTAFLQDASIEFNDNFGGLTTMRRVTTKCFDDTTPRPYFNTMFNSQIIGIAPQKHDEVDSFDSDSSIYRGHSMHPEADFSLDGHLKYHDGTNTANDTQNSAFAVGEMSHLKYSFSSPPGKAFGQGQTTPFTWWYVPAAISIYRPQSYYMLLAGRGVQDPYATSGNPNGDRDTAGNYNNVWTSHYNTAPRFESQSLEYALRIRGYGASCRGRFFVKNETQGPRFVRRTARFQMGGRA